MDIDERLSIIKRNCEEIVTEKELRELLEKKKNPSVYIGTAITGKPHIAYFIWIIKLADFLKAGFKVKLLLADIHGALDNTPWDLLGKRYEYYKIVIPAMFKSIGVKSTNFEIVRGSDFQNSPSYFYDTLRLSTIASVHDCRKAGSEVVKQSDNPKLSGLIYPIMQALDEEYLKVDVQYGGNDQRKILMFAREYLPKIGYQSRVEIMTPIIPGLIGEKMSSSAEESKIDLLDSDEIIKRKLNKAFWPEGNVESNGILNFIKYVIMVIKEENNEEFLIERPEKWGGNVIYKTYSQLEKDYKDKKVHPMDVKTALARELSRLLQPVRESMVGKEKIVKEAYP